MLRYGLTRRGFVGGVASVAAASVLGACGSQNTETDQADQAAETDGAAQEGAATDAEVAEVQVTGGTISGEMSEDGQVAIYKGIPYAAPPVGDLRWKAPAPVVPWEGTRECVQYAPAAIQPEQAPFMMWTEEFIIDTSLGYDEDCLYLNVWAPVDAKDAPVVLFIHGGGNTSGGASCDVYDGTEIAKKGVVYVDCNYRVGIFGFLATTELSEEDPDHVSGNYALKDLLAVLGWIKDNIASFGGDPDNVTITGQSAGCQNVNMLTICPEAAGLFNNAITMSFSLVGTKMVTLADKEAEGDAIFEGKTLEEMRAMPADEVQALSGSDLATAVASYCIDDTYVIGDYDEVLSAGKGLSVNVVTGQVAGDRLLFGSFLSGASALVPGSAEPETAADYEALAKEKLADLAENFLSLYPVETDADVAAQVLASNADYEVALETKNADLRKQNNEDDKVFVYYFSHVMPGPEAEAMGAFHTADVPYWINHYSLARADYWTDVDHEVGDAMSNYLVNLASTGDVNGDDVEPWTAYERGSDITYMEFGDVVAEKSFDDKKNAFWKAYFEL